MYNLVDREVIKQGNEIANDVEPSVRRRGEGGRRYRQNLANRERRRGSRGRLGTQSDGATRTTSPESHGAAAPTDLILSQLRASICRWL